MSKNSYRSLEQVIISHFCDTSINNLCSGTRLNNSESTPYIKKRLAGRGGFRIYYLFILKDKKLYLMFVHPKTGSLGAPNITDASRVNLYKEVLECIKSNNLYKIKFDKDAQQIIFSQ